MTASSLSFKLAVLFVIAGMAMGIGMADATTDRLVSGIDWKPTLVNALSAGNPSRIRVPAHFASDRECLDWVAATEIDWGLGP